MESYKKKLRFYTGLFFSFPSSEFAIGDYAITNSDEGAGICKKSADLPRF